MRTLIASLIIITIASCSVKESNANETIDTASSSKNVESTEKLIGAWQAEETNENGEVIKHVLTLTSGYFSEVMYIENPPTFIQTMGGQWHASEDFLTWKLEFHTQDTSLVGQQVKVAFELDNDAFIANGLTWASIDDGTPGDLTGAWLITGRKRNGETRRRTPGERKTMKILSGTRFQWIAYHTGNGEFFGTGGGTYTTIDGKYTENIEFFSRDSSRVGASLQFDYQLDSGEWYHSGLSSKGELLMEIWTPREMLDSMN
jgi:hypothetical protein